MSLTFDLVLSGLLQGLVLALVATGLMVPFRILNTPDLTVEGAYPLGGAVCAVMIVQGSGWCAGVCAGMICASLLGVAAGWIGWRLRMNILLVGIVLATMVWSLNLRLLGQPSLSLFGQPGLWPQTPALQAGILACVCTGLVGLLVLFLHTDYGLRLRAAGQDALFARHQGISVPLYTLLALALAGGLAGLAGGLMVVWQQYTDAGMGTGILIHGLASLMTGEALLGRSTLARQCWAPVVGALVYQQIQGLVLAAGLAPSDMKCLTGLCVLGLAALNPRSFRGS